MTQELQHTAAPPALDQLRLEDFASLQGSCFRIHFSAEFIAEATLVTVLALKGYTTLERNPFSLLWQTGLHQTYFTQGMYSVSHPDLGTMDLFLVPVGVRQGGMQYEAVFS